MARTAAGNFRDRAAAGAAYADLIAHGFSKDHISILGQRGEGGDVADAEDHHVTARDGVKIGGITGLLLGAAALLMDATRLARR